MRVDKFTSNLQMVLAEAQSIALGNDNQFVEPIHMLAAMLKSDEASIKPLLTQAGVQITKLERDVTLMLEALPMVSSNGDIHISQALVRVFNLAEKMAMEKGDSFISTDLFLLALVKGDNLLSKVLRDAGASEKTLEKTIESVRGGDAVDDANAEANRGVLKKYTVDLTALAEQGSLTPLSGEMKKCVVPSKFYNADVKTTRC